MTTSYAMIVLAVATAASAAHMWWMFSGLAAWFEPDDRDEQPPPTGTLSQGDHDD